MTKKLYDFDGHRSTFESTVLSCEKAEKGWRATLDQTARNSGFAGNFISPNG